MEKFKTGNIVKDEFGNIHIVVGYRTIKSRVDYQVIDWVSFTSENTSGSTRVLESEREEECGCFFLDNEGNYLIDSDCRICKGEGSVMRFIPGTTTWTLLGHNCKDYITNSLVKNFNF
jgi:hypothetical protein